MVDFEPLMIGLKFLPSDHDIMALLIRKANGLPVNTHGGILDDCDIYGDETIWMNKFLDTNKEELFFFSRLRKKFDHGMRIDRASFNGTWKESNSKTIMSENKIVGTKHFFNFIPKKGFSIKERWLMNEFRVAGGFINRVKDASIVVCKISRKKALRSRREVEEQNPEDVKMLQVVPSTLSLQNNNESVEPATMLQTVKTETAPQEETVQEQKDLRMLQIVPSPLSLQYNNKESVALALATMPQTLTTETGQEEEETVIQGSEIDDSPTEVWLEVDDLLSSPKSDPSHEIYC